VTGFSKIDFTWRRHIGGRVLGRPQIVAFRPDSDGYSGAVALRRGFRLTERAAVPVAIALLAGAAAIGFGGGVLVSLSVGSGAAPAAAGQSGGDGKDSGSVVAGASVTATCEQDSGREADGSKVTYGPEHVLDDDPATAWRCESNGRGERLSVKLGAPAVITEVGLIPGYAKTDPADRTDRYKENRRLSKVRWHFDRDVTIEQKLDPSPGNRELQRIAVPAVTSSTVVLEVLDSVSAERDRIAVSSVAIKGTPAQ
jgi:hypothetical protein